MKDELFNEMITSVREGGAILRGAQPASRSFAIQPPDIKLIRDGFGLTQEQFAALLGISVRTLRNCRPGTRAAPGGCQAPGGGAGCGAGKKCVTMISRSR
jgi:putative transcriptional regulator